MSSKSKPTLRGLLLFTLLTSCYLLAASRAEAGIRVQGVGGAEGIKDSVLIDGTGFGSTPLPGAVSLPAATSLTLEASPPVIPMVPVTLVSTPSATLSVTASGTQLINGAVTITSSSVPAGPPRNTTQLQTCRKSLQLLADTTVAGYTRQPHESYMEVLAAATVLDGIIMADQPGDIAPLKKALGHLPWRGVLRSEIQQAGKLTQTFCAPTGGWKKSASVDN